MRILLLGDYSGFFKNLKDGLIQIGHEVDLATTGDGFKDTAKSDIYMPGKSQNRIVKKIDRIVFPATGIIKKYYDYDLAFLINHDIFGGTKYGININHLLLRKIRQNTSKMFISICALDNYVFELKNKLEYNPYEAYIDIDMKGKNYYMHPNYIKNNENVLGMVDGIIPTMYTYAEAYRRNTKLMNTIPFPINVDSIKFIPPKTDGKLRIFHGINRRGYKGTEYIEDAMQRIKTKYPNDVEILIDGGMPLNKYLRVIEESDVIVDQALSYCYGMNAIYSMAMGKVVLSGNEQECQREFKRTDIPIINIKPSTDDIYNKLEELVADIRRVEEIGYNSRRFVEDFHHYVKVAKQYVNAWNI